MSNSSSVAVGFLFNPIAGMGGEVGAAPAGTGSSGYGQTNQKYNKKVSASQNPGFGHKPSGAGAANNPFIGNNPN